jgi:hypothetical protein
MSTRPVLVVHGIATHVKTEFEQRVTTLQNTIKRQLPNVELIPVFWGDLGGHSVNIDDCLPQLRDGEWTTRAEDLVSISSSDPEVRAEPKLGNDERASIITGCAMNSELVRSDPDTTKIAITQALAQTDHLQKIDDKEVLKAIGDIINEALSEQFAPVERGTFEVRGEPSTFETRGWIGNKAKGVIAGIDKLVGKLIEDRLGVLNQRLRGSLMNGVAATLGDIVAYHSNKKAIQGRIWKAVNDDARGYGTEANPIGLIAHSLGGVISFDAMVAPASGTALYVNSFVSFGSQAAFFEIIDPRRPGWTYTNGHPIELPVTIKQWFNLWDVVDLLAFTAGTVFRFRDGSKPEDIPVEDPLSVMLDEKLWLHSIYWESPQLLAVLTKAFGS